MLISPKDWILCDHVIKIVMSTDIKTPLLLVISTFAFSVLNYLSHETRVNSATTELTFSQSRCDLEGSY